VADEQVAKLFGHLTQILLINEYPARHEVGVTYNGHYSVLVEQAIQVPDKVK
jgi:hypothetical protein